MGNNASLTTVRFHAAKRRLALGHSKRKIGRDLHMSCHTIDRIECADTLQAYHDILAMERYERDREEAHKDFQEGLPMQGNQPIRIPVEPTLFERFCKWIRA